MPPQAAAPRVSTSALHRLLQCERRLWLSHHHREHAAAEDEHDGVMRERGRALEARVAGTFEGLEGPVYAHGMRFAEAAEATREHLLAGRGVWQAALVSPDELRSGVADFVVREPGGWVVHEAKLSHRPERRPEVQLQLTHHAAIVEAITGEPVVRTEATNGLGARVAIERWPEERYTHAVERTRAVLASETEPTQLLAHSVCRDCPFYEHCWSMAEADGRIEVLVEVDKAGATALHAMGVHHVAELAAIDEAALTHVSLRSRARRIVAEAQARHSNQAVWLRPPQLPKGRTLVWFDLEGDSGSSEDELPIYLWGLAVETDEGAEPEAHFADLSSGGDVAGWRRFLARIEQLLDQGHDPVFVHWHSYERQWVDHYLKHHGAAPRLRSVLSADRHFFDLHRVIERCLRLPLRSYSVKFVAPWMGFRWRNPESGSEWSIAQFHRARRTEDPAERASRLAAIAEYNADDVLAMRAVWRWIEANQPGDGG